MSSSWSHWGIFLLFLQLWWTDLPAKPFKHFRVFHQICLLWLFQMKTALNQKVCWWTPDCTEVNRQCLKQTWSHWSCFNVFTSAAGSFRVDYMSRFMCEIIWLSLCWTRRWKYRTECWQSEFEASLNGHGFGSFHETLSNILMIFFRFLQVRHSLCIFVNLAATKQ